MLCSFDPTMSIADAVRQIDKVMGTKLSAPALSGPGNGPELGITPGLQVCLTSSSITFQPTTISRLKKSPAKPTNLSYGFTAPWVVTIADTGALAMTLP